MEFLESRLVQMLIHPAFAAGRIGFRVFQQGARRALQLMERVTGLAFLQDISEFLLAFEGMSAGFRERAARVRGLLLGPEAGFVLVAGPGGDAVRQSAELRERLTSFGVELCGVLANRMHRWPDGSPPSALVPGAQPPSEDLAALAAALRTACGAGVPAERAARAALDAASGYAALVRRDERATRPLREAIERGGGFWGAIPELPEDVHDLAGLARVADAIFAGEGSGDEREA
jgi:hypothetical protein